MFGQFIFRFFALGNIKRYIAEARNNPFRIANQRNGLVDRSSPAMLVYDFENYILDGNAGYVYFFINLTNPLCCIWIRPRLIVKTQQYSPRQFRQSASGIVDESNVSLEIRFSEVDVEIIEDSLVSFQRFLQGSY